MNELPGDFSRELYPYLYGAAQTDGDAFGAVLAAVKRSTLEKCEDVLKLRRELLAEYEPLLANAASAMAARFARGAKLLAFGNGGSATDADDAAADCVTPPIGGWRRLPAFSLSSDSATMSGVANDVGFENVFVRQLIALGKRGDIALGISTSGNSPNVVAALVEARRRGMLTIGLAGNDGGVIARDGHADFCFIARREFVPRIQEGHATLWHALLSLAHAALGNPNERER